MSNASDRSVWDTELVLVEPPKLPPPAVRRRDEPWCLDCIANYLALDRDGALQAVNEIKRRYEGPWGPRSEFPCRGCSAGGVETWAMRGEMLQVLEEHYLKDEEAIVDEAEVETVRASGSSRT